MAKPDTQHVCTSCGHTQVRWAGRCPACGEFNTLEEQAIPNANGKANGSKAIARTGVSAAAPAAVRKLGDHRASDYPRFSSGVSELDRVLGGGIVPGSAMLLGGLPGSGKSTMLSEVADYLAGQGKRVVYVAGEESGEQIRLRTDRMSLKHSDEIDVTGETEVGAICSLIAGGYDFAVVDSIQTLYDAELTGAAGSTSIVKQVGHALVRTAKETGCAILIIGHFTKDGTVAGPQHLSHMVDVMMELVGERTESFRLLRAPKNRFGSTAELGVFEMKAEGLKGVDDPTSMFLEEQGDPVPGSVICPIVEGSRPMLIEVQALVTPTALQMPKRTVVGIDRNRLDMLLAILAQRGGLSKLGTKDVYVKVSGGMRVEDPALDLAVCLAIASADTKRCVRQGVAAFGEVSLKGQVRPVPQSDRRVTEATRLGFPTVVAASKQGTVGVQWLRSAVDKALESEPTITPLADADE